MFRPPSYELQSSSDDSYKDPTLFKLPQSLSIKSGKLFKRKSLNVDTVRKSALQRLETCYSSTPVRQDELNSFKDLPLSPITNSSLNSKSNLVTDKENFKSIILEKLKIDETTTKQLEKILENSFTRKSGLITKCNNKCRTTPTSIRSNFSQNTLRSLTNKITEDLKNSQPATHYNSVITISSADTSEIDKIPTDRAKVENDVINKNILSSVVQCDENSSDNGIAVKPKEDQQICPVTSHLNIEMRENANRKAIRNVKAVFSPIRTRLRSRNKKVCEIDEAANSKKKKGSSKKKVSSVTDNLKVIVENQATHLVNELQKEKQAVKKPNSKTTSTKKAIKNKGKSTIPPVSPVEESIPTEISEKKSIQQDVIQKTRSKIIRKTVTNTNTKKAVVSPVPVEEPIPAEISLEKSLNQNAAESHNVIQKSTRIVTRESTKKAILPVNSIEEPIPADVLDKGNLQQEDSEVQKVIRKTTRSRVTIKTTNKGRTKKTKTLPADPVKELTPPKENQISGNFGNSLPNSEITNEDLLMSLSLSKSTNPAKNPKTNQSPVSEANEKSQEISSKYSVEVVQLYQYIYNRKSGFYKLPDEPVTYTNDNGRPQRNRRPPPQYIQATFIPDLPLTKKTIKFKPNKEKIKKNVRKHVDFPDKKHSFKYSGTNSSRLPSMSPTPPCVPDITINKRPPSSRRKVPKENINSVYDYTTRKTQSKRKLDYDNSDLKSKRKSDFNAAVNCLGNSQVCLSDNTVVALASSSDQKITLEKEVEEKDNAFLNCLVNNESTSIQWYAKKPSFTDEQTDNIVVLRCMENKKQNETMLCGFMKIRPQCKFLVEANKSYSILYKVEKGECNARVAGKDTCLQEGSTIFIPLGLKYFIKNSSRQENLVLYFVQSSK